MVANAKQCPCEEENINSDGGNKIKTKSDLKSKTNVVNFI